MGSSLLRDRFWLWGHNAGSHHLPDCSYWRIPGVNRMGPAEAGAYLGIPNCCRVVFHGEPHPPFDAAAEELTQFRRVVWSVLGDSSSTRNDDGGDDLEEVLRQAQLHENVVGGILDDFFRPAQGDARLSPSALRGIQERLHRSGIRPLSLWLVYYAELFRLDYRAWLEFADVITFWSWNSQQLLDAEKNLHRIIGMTPGKEHYAGCYLYNYGDCRPLSKEEMRFQLSLYYRLLKERQIDGVIVCSNNVVDVGLEAPELMREFLLEHGDEELGERDSEPAG